MTLADAVHAAMGRDAEARCTRPVVRDGTVEWTARTLLRAIERIADELRVLDVPRDGLVAAVLPSGAPLLATFLAAGEVPLTPVVFEQSWDDELLHDALTRVRPSAVLTDQAGRERMGAVVSRVSVPPVALDVGAVLDRLPGERSEPRRTRAPVSCGYPRPTTTATTRAPAGTSPHIVLMTSGSTGPPKGVCRTHASWLQSFAATREIGPSRADSVAVPGSLASSWFLYAAIEALCAGATVRVWDHADPAAIVDGLHDGRMTHLAVVPTLLDQCVVSARRRGVELPALRRIVSCGGSWPSGLRARTLAVAPHARIHDVYGAAEWSVVSTRERTQGPEDADLGRPVPGVEISIRDDQGRSVLGGGSGALWVRSPLTFERYVGTLDDEQPSAGDTVVRDAAGFIAVGDLARYAAGRLILIGRRDHILVCRGSKVHPELVERALSAFDGVTDVAVTLATDGRRGEHLVALLQLARPVTRGALRVHVRARLPPAARPARFLVVTNLPRSAAGKLDRDRLPALVAGAHPVAARLSPAEGSRTS